MGWGEVHQTFITIDPSGDPADVLDDITDALSQHLAMTSSNRLDPGQRAMATQALIRLDQITNELRENP